MSIPDGFVLADKPADLGSAALVGILRRRLNRARVGHTGTLDRFASGLMLLLVGRGASLAEYFLHADKTYRATFAFGRATDTHDPAGATIAERSPAEVRAFFSERRAELDAALAEIRSATLQIPPLYSALKLEGRRYSDRARAGQTDLPPARPVRVYDMQVGEPDLEGGTLAVELSVSGGAYIRAFARDLGQQLDFPVHLAALRRLAIGIHRLDHPDVWRPDEAEPPRVRRLQEALPDWPRVLVADPERQRALALGQRPPLAGLPEAGDFFIEDAGGGLLAWARAAGGDYRYRRVFTIDSGKGVGPTGA